MRSASALLLTAALASIAAPGGAEPLAAGPLGGRYDAFVTAAAACAAATGRNGVDSRILAAAGWADRSSVQTDEKALSAVRSQRNPFVLRMHGSSPDQADECWLAAGFRQAGDYDRVRQRLQQRFGRGPDDVDKDDMRGARWLSPQSVTELWMMPRHPICPECPMLFFSARRRQSQ